MPCFHCHVSINLTASHSAHLLGAKKTWPNKIKRRLGIPIETRAESNQRAARRAGRANPCRWNRRHITPSVDRAQRIAFEDEHKAVLAAERMVCWSKVPIFQYYKNHERTKKRRREYQAKKTREDLVYRLRGVLRRAARRACEAGGKRKEYRSEKYLGCTVGQAKLHIQKQFQKGMNWNNYGRAWHIDHVIPLASWDLTKEDHRMRAANILNLQPLWARDNLKKGARLVGQHQMALL
jgi:hypothetical protein